MLKSALVLAFTVYATYEVCRYWSFKTSWGVELQDHHAFLNHDASKELKQEFGHKKGFEPFDQQFQMSNAKIHMGLWVTSLVLWAEDIRIIDLIARTRDWFLSTTVMQFINPQNTWMQVATPILLVIMFCYIIYCLKEYCLNSSYLSAYTTGKKSKHQAKKAKTQGKDRLDLNKVDTAKSFAEEIAASLD